ncbi:MAG: helix-turn-helix domain-containing protein [Phycisphaerae bacterium]
MTDNLTEEFRLAKLLNVKKVSELLGMGERTIWRMAGDGTLPQPIKLGTRLRFWRLTDLEEFVQKKRPA